MYVALNVWALPDELMPSDQIRAVAEAGFSGIELVVGTEGPLTFDTAPDAFAAFGKQAADASLRVTSLASAAFWQCNYASRTPAEREQARTRTLRLLDLAAAAEAGAILVVPAVVGRAGDPAPQVSYSDALHHTIEALDGLRFEAESRGVAIALENVWNRFLLSPLEAADLLDKVNSPFVGWYFDVGNILTYGYPEDWIRELGRRIVRVHIKDYDLARPGREGFCPLGEGSVDWPGVMNALRDVGYDSALTFEGPGDPDDLRERMRRVLSV